MTGGATTQEEHARITRALATEGGHLESGHAGFSLEWKHGCLTGCICDELKDACIARGLPVIDSRKVPFAALARIVISGPMIAVGRSADHPPGTRCPTRRSLWSRLRAAPQVLKSTIFRKLISTPAWPRLTPARHSRPQES